MFLVELRAMTMMLEMMNKIMKTKMIIIRAIKIYQMQFERLFEIKLTQMMSNHGKAYSREKITPILYTVP